MSMFPYCLVYQRKHNLCYTMLCVSSLTGALESRAGRAGVCRGRAAERISGQLLRRCREVAVPLAAECMRHRALACGLARVPLARRTRRVLRAASVFVRARRRAPRAPARRASHSRAPPPRWYLSSFYYVRM